MYYIKFIQTVIVSIANNYIKFIQTENLPIAH